MAQGVWYAVTSKVKRGFRETFQFFTPWWLNAGWDTPEDVDAADIPDGAKVLWTLHATHDAVRDRWEQSLRARFPTLCAVDGRESALALHEKNRGIKRGRTEDATRFAARLVEWRYPRGHRIRGSAPALLTQMFHYLGPTEEGVAGCEAFTIDVSGNLFQITTAGDITRTPGTAWTWDAGASLGKFRFWTGIVPGALTSAHPDWGDAALWGGSIGGQYLLGFQGLTREDIQALIWFTSSDNRRPWKPAGAQKEWLIVSLNGDVPGSGMVPDATWADWAEYDGSGYAVPARSDDYRYIALDPDRLLAYVPTDRGFIPTGHTNVGGGLYTWVDNGSVPASYTMPDGSTYSPSTASFPASIPLPDDGFIQP